MGVCKRAQHDAGYLEYESVHADTLRWSDVGLPLLCVEFARRGREFIHQTSTWTNVGVFKLTMAQRRSKTTPILQLARNLYCPRLRSQRTGAIPRLPSDSTVLGRAS